MYRIANYKMYAIIKQVSVKNIHLLAIERIINSIIKDYSYRWNISRNILNNYQIVNKMVSLIEITFFS